MISQCSVLYIIPFREQNSFKDTSLKGNKTRLPKEAYVLRFYQRIKSVPIALTYVMDYDDKRGVIG